MITKKRATITGDADPVEDNAGTNVTGKAAQKNRPRRRLIFFWLIGVAALIASMTISLLCGRYGIEPASVWNSLLGIEESSAASNIVVSVRVPRILLVALVGGGLAVSGAAYQGVFQNPLVSPDVLSVSSGAAFGAVLGIMISGDSALIIILALSMGLVSVMLAYLFAKIKGHVSVLSLVLSGMIMSALFNALISLMKYVADTDTQLPEITYWLLGSFAGTTYKDIAIVIFPIVIGSILLILLGNKINILSLGDEEARSLGVNPDNARKLIIFLATVITAASITVTGIIGWVGLVIPHIARLIVGPNHTRLIPASALTGATFLTIIDLLSRTITVTEMPVGILTAIIGAPFFALLFHKQGAKRL